MPIYRRRPTTVKNLGLTTGKVVKPGAPTSLALASDLEQIAEALRVLQQRKEDMAKIITPRNGIMGLNPILVKKIVSGKVDDAKAYTHASLPFHG